MRANAAGYTLLELLVVIAIVSLITALAAPAAVRAIASATINADARRLAGDLRQLQQIAEERQETITISNAASGIKIEPDAGLELPAENVVLADATHRLVYFADGTTSGGTLRVSEEGRSIDLDVAWLTGSIAIGEADATR